MGVCLKICGSAEIAWVRVHSKPCILLQSYIWPSLLRRPFAVRIYLCMLFCNVLLHVYHNSHSENGAAMLDPSCTVQFKPGDKVKIAVKRGAKFEPKVPLLSFVCLAACFRACLVSASSLVLLSLSHPWLISLRSSWSLWARSRAVRSARSRATDPATILTVS